MWPVFLRLGPITIYTYGVLVAAGFLAALLLTLRQAPRFGVDKAFVWDWSFYVLLGAILGARLLYWVVERPSIRWDWRGIADVFLHAGGVFYGGFLGAVLVSLWFLRRRGVSVWTAGDLVAAPLALGHAIGRVGCLSAGCCYGQPTHVPWAVTFTNPLAGELIGTPLNVPVHPTQVYESLWNLLLAGGLMGLARWPGRRPGDLWWAYVGLYAVGRFVIEFYRGDPRGAWGGLSTSQWIAIGAVGATLVGLWGRRGRRPLGESATRGG